jgi:hypothetical protein
MRNQTQEQHAMGTELVLKHKWLLFFGGLGDEGTDMKKFVVMAGFLALFAGILVRAQDRAEHAGDMKHVIVRPDAFKWGPVPPSAPPGAQAAVLVGDSSKEGVPTLTGSRCPTATRYRPTGTLWTRTLRC